MHVFVDTNVWIAALIARGTCAELVDHLIAQHVIWYSPLVDEEVLRVLSEKFGYSEGRVRGVKLWLEDVARCTPRIDDAPEITGDRADDFVLKAALEAPSEVLVTGDSDLLDVDVDAALVIVEPAGFWRIG